MGVKQSNASRVTAWANAQGRLGRGYGGWSV